MQRNMKIIDSFTKAGFRKRQTSEYRIYSGIKYVMDKKSAIIFAVD